MIKFYLSSIILLVIACTLLAQPAFNGSKRLQQIKKMKMLDELNLNEETGDKFLLKYNAWENKLEETHEEFSIATKELRLAIDKNADDATLSEKTSKFIELQEKLHKIQQDKMQDMKEILTKEEFARYIIFEVEFHRRIKELMIEGGKKRRLRHPLD